MGVMRWGSTGTGPGLACACALAGGLWVSPLLLGAEEPPEPPSDDASILGAPAAFDLSADANERVVLPAGTTLHKAPAPRAPSLVRLDVDVELIVLDRRGAWLEVRFDGIDGWARADGNDGTPTRDLLPETLPESLKPSGLDPKRLADVIGRLRGEPESLTMGPYRLHTDIPDNRHRRRLLAIGRRIDEAFARRYGIEVPPPTNEAVVISGSDDVYRDIADDHPEIADLGSLGHAGGGIAVLFVGDRPPRHVESSLVHEVVHLVTRRAFGLELPIWLEEAIAEDLGYCDIDDDGKLVLGSTSTLAPSRQSRVTAKGVFVVEREAGGASALRDLRENWLPGRRPSLETLIDLPRDAFLQRNRALHYALAAFFLRFLLDGGDPGLSNGIRAFLGEVARGGDVGTAQLRRHLGTDWATLEDEFVRWLRTPSKRRSSGPDRGGTSPGAR